MTPNPNIAIYGALFQDDPPPYADQLSQMQEASFTTVVLWALHVHDTGDFYLNDTPAVSNGQMIYDTDPKKGLNPDLPKLLAELRETSPLTDVLISIGPFTSDFQAIQANPQVAQENFRALIAALGIDAVDFDYEGDYSDADQTMVVDLTLMLGTLGVGVTYCPYTADSWWIECLAQVYAKKGSQLVRWLNLQCYDGGSGNDPAVWAGELATSQKPLGISDSGAFVVPGYWAKNGGPKRSMCPSEIEAKLTAAHARGICGAFIWDFSDLFASEGAGLCGQQDVTPKGYSEAIAAGLGAVAAPSAAPPAA
jgi:hypothetical protein